MPTFDEQGYDPEDFAVPPILPTVDLTKICTSSSFRRDDAVEALANTTAHVNRALALEEARRRIAQEEKTNRSGLTKALKELASSPLIGKDTQAAFFKSIMVEYMEAAGSPDPSDKLAAPALRDVLTAAKLLNETAGLNAPTKVETSMDITLKAFPVAQAPFRGELPELEIRDAQVTPL